MSTFKITVEKEGEKADTIETTGFILLHLHEDYVAQHCGITTTNIELARLVFAAQSFIDQLLEKYPDVCKLVQLATALEEDLHVTQADATDTTDSTDKSDKDCDYSEHDTPSDNDAPTEDDEDIPLVKE